MRNIWPVLTVTLLASSAFAQQLPREAIARFHINDASYLSDVGKYLEAIEQLDTAFDFSQDSEIKAEALSLKAGLLSAFLDNPQAAIAQYDTILQNFSATLFYEPALFQSGMLRYENGDLDGARTFFERYMREFPAGASATTAEFMLDRIRVGERPKPREAVPQTRNMRIALKSVDFVELSSSQPLSMDGRSLGMRSRIALGDIDRNAARVTSKAPIRVDGVAYRGAIVLMPNGAKLQVINDVPIEEYLYSVVASEVFASWPMDALKAQAVAARTYAYYHVAHPKSPGRFDLFDDTRSQAYGGYAKEHPRVRQAVDGTRGQVLTSGGRVLLAYFTSNNGGAMADPAFVFGVAFSYLKANPDTVSRGQHLGRWSRRFSTAVVEQALQSAGYAVSGIRRIVPVKTCPSGRLVEIQIDYRGGQIKLNTRSQFRTALNNHIRPAQNPENLPDTLVSIQINGGNIELAGGGWGHGVGLSQYGAKGMAELGRSYQEILTTYYIGAELKNLL